MASTFFYGDNAQGKTNILEGIYLCMTNKSYRGSHDKEMIRFGKEEAHLRLEAEKKGIPYRVDMHLKKSKTKGIAINGVPIRRSSELIGLLNVVFFSPEDLQVIKTVLESADAFWTWSFASLTRCICIF